MLGALVSSPATSREKEDAIEFLVAGGNYEYIDGGRIRAEGCMGYQKAYLREFTRISPQNQTDDIYIELAVDFSHALWNTFRIEYRNTREILVVDCGEECMTVSIDGSGDTAIGSRELLRNFAAQLSSSLNSREIVTEVTVDRARLQNAANALEQYCGSEGGRF